MTKNPLTFKHISGNIVLPTGPPVSFHGTSTDNAEPHNVGEIWCAVAFVIGGLKLTPPQPTFIQARDGVISAISAMAPGDVAVARTGFAKRGMGRGAVGPPSNSFTLAGVVESFTP